MRDLALTTVRLATALALLISVTGTAVAADPKPRTFKGKLVKQKAAVSSQAIGRTPLREVGESIPLAGSTFTAAVAGGRLKIAAAAGQPPKRHVTSGKSIDLKDGDTKVALTFLQSGDDTWNYFATSSYAYTIDGVEILLIDVDADGRFGEMDEDAWTLHGSRVAMPIQESTPLDRHRLLVSEIAPDGTSITATLEPIEGSRQQTDALLALNRLRALHGITPVTLDAKLSKGCTDHAQYLTLNKWTGWTNPHTQSLGPEGATPDGASAAASSVIVFGTPAVGVVDFWLTYYHRLTLMDPVLESIGVNAAPTTICVIDTVSARREGPPVLLDPVCIPADGGTLCPTGAVTELPNDPVTEMDSRGWPLTVYFGGREPDVTEFEAVLVELPAKPKKKGKHKDGKPVPLLRADQGTFTTIFGFVPEKPLSSGALHRATYTWKSGGESFTRSVRFQTE